ncbi:MAG: hypothetical protein PUE30_03925 [Spirochaetia bacterium]|nr:hypothetical protein [Spirochaetia bacterium]
MKKNSKKSVFFAFSLLMPGLFVLASFSACQSPHSAYASASEDGQLYKMVENAVNAPDSLFLTDVSFEQNINGTYPDHIFVKTRTQTFTKDYEFMIRSGKLLYKPKDEALWKLYCDTGLPEGALSVTEIFGDSNCVFVFDEQGRLYRTYTEKEVRKNAASPFYVKPFTWIYLFGWPESVVFKQGVLAKNNRAWAMGARRKDVLWHEDIFKNQHHYGTMGLETIYFLTEKGNEIRFTDSGLPADLSKSFLTPENGRFIAVNLSNSASTNFIIGDRGTMYTRLIDFDTMGCDPMFFKYTYEPFESKYSGSEYRSNYENWGLPAEDWFRQPDIPLEGKARLSKFISIHQNGQGNAARELRVAGLDSEGRTGFYSKQIFEQEWKFINCLLFLKEDDFLSGGEEWGEPLEYSFKGSVFEDGKPVEGVSVSVEDFTLANEGKFNLKFTMEKDGWQESKTLKFYDVEMWTYMERFDPGKDGMPKNFFVTPDYSQEDLNCEHEEFSDLLKKMFDGLDRKTFCIKSSATVNYMELDWENGKGFFGNDGKFAVFMDKNGTSGNPSVLKGIYKYEDPLVTAFNKPELLFEKDLYFTSDLQALENVRQANLQYEKLLEGQMKVYNGYKHNTNMSRWEWNLADLVLSVTFLNQIDFPKIKTVSMYSGDLFTANAENYASSYEYMSVVYPHVQKLVRQRAEKYSEILEEVKKNGTALRPEYYRDSYSRYFDSLNVEKAYAGVSVQDGKNAVLLRLSQIPLCPGFVFYTQKENGETDQYIILELEDFEKEAAEALKKGEKEFECGAKFSITAKNEKILNRYFGIRKLEKKKGKFIFDGKNVKIKAGRKVLFDTSLRR